MTGRGPDWRGDDSVRRARMAEAAAVCLVAAHNWASNRRIAQRWYVPANLAAAAATLALARWGGASWSDLGLHNERLRAGVRNGATASALAAAGVGAALAIPASRRWFADERAIAASPRTAAYHAAVRIPLGTALGEELLFRAALLGLSLQRRSWIGSLAWTSALFGAWHVLPTVATLPGNPLGRRALDAGRRIDAIGTAVATTAAAGGAFALLRHASGSVAAPVLAHAAINVAAYLGARRAHVAALPSQPRLVQRRTG